MAILNIEFKAVTNRLAELEQLLQERKPIFKGEDHQVDIYFNVAYGRLKLREGNIENALIHYERENTAGSKSSQVLLYRSSPGSSLKEILVRSLGIKATVKKIRRIYFVGNVKIHFDTIEELGTFVEVEAIDEDGSIGKQQLQEQCDDYTRLFKIDEHDFVAFSYSDLLGGIE